MARDKFGETIQAVEINAATFIGTASNIYGSGAIIHANGDGNITFHFKSGDKTISVSEGSDWVAGLECTGITSTMEIIIT